ncbi:hypothetical protein SAMN02799622_06090 [Methylobacterium sp. UNC378MF]|uniref:hypothetical protein n=1 Tax=Methylobacterium sp. UNC378MF TaxID=1502748 RepID=UPI0008894398|nr:hypothetical protein [Methylobacterium sp. UNC378MF]SDA35428.1 hypothetical protein SAMN02799622_06090 [Methylobacterium sp. UNC378MF]
MSRARQLSPALFLGTMLIVGAAGRAQAADATATRHEIWRDCLSRNFRIQAVLTERDLAADAAFLACRGSEEAYLTALAGSPLLDETDIARARPLVAGRFRAWLVGRNG